MEGGGRVGGRERGAVFVMLCISLWTLQAQHPVWSCTRSMFTPVCIFLRKLAVTCSTSAPGHSDTNADECVLIQHLASSC